jgi:hypothetical protein
MCPLRYLNGRTPSPVPAEAKHRWILSHRWSRLEGSDNTVSSTPTLNQGPEYTLPTNTNEELKDLILKKFLQTDLHGPTFYSVTAALIQTLYLLTVTSILEIVSPSRLVSNDSSGERQVRYLQILRTRLQ